MNIAGLKYKPYQKLPPNIWLKRALRKNSILSEEYLDSLPQVIKGQKVHIKILGPSIALDMEATAQDDGYLGQTIKIKNTNNSKIFTALVTASNQAKVQE